MAAAVWMGLGGFKRPARLVGEWMGVHGRRMGVWMGPGGSMVPTSVCTRKEEAEEQVVVVPRHARFAFVRGRWWWCRLVFARGRRRRRKRWWW
jgi:hypothetical protein